MQSRNAVLLLMFISFGSVALGQYTFRMDPGMSALNADLVQIANRTEYFLRLAADIDLTEPQRKKLEELFFRTQTLTVRYAADLNVADAELVRLLSSEKVDMPAIASKVREIERMQSQATIDNISAALEAVRILTHPQHLKVIMTIRSREPASGPQSRDG